jgi:hypothetical protein
MATVILKSADLAAATPAIPYTVPAGKTAAVTVRFTNRTPDERLVRLALSPTDTPTASTYIEYEQRVPGNGVLNNSGIVVPAGTRIVAQAHQAGVSINLWGYEE